MISFKDRPDFGWNLLLIAAVIGIAVSIWYGFISPVKVISPAGARHVAELNLTIARAHQKVVDDKHSIRRYCWDAPPDTLGSSVLDNLTEMAGKHSVQLTSFRTDKANDVVDLTEVPFVAIIEGGFPDVVAFTQALEDPGSKLAVNLLQVSASDSGPGRVTATFGLLGFLLKEPR